VIHTNSTKLSNSHKCSTENANKREGKRREEKRILFGVSNQLWPESESEVYRPIYRRLSAKLLPTSADRGCHAVSVTVLYGSILCFLHRSRYFLNCDHEAEWTPFQTHYLSENLAAPRIEPGPLELWPLDHRGGPCNIKNYPRNRPWRPIGL
jgi:hypothetical protein